MILEQIGFSSIDVYPSLEVVKAVLDHQFSTYIISGLITLSVIFLFYMIVIRLIMVRKTKEYRKVMADLFVVGKIRKLADEEYVDLEDEEVNFKKWLKKIKLSDSRYELDDVIEEEMKEKISESSLSKKEVKQKIPKK